MQVDGNSDNFVDNYLADVLSSTDYYPFGQEMPGRTFSSNRYRYGYNGMEKDDEMKGSGNSYDFGARIYDSRLGRWLSKDPLEWDFPSHSPYNSCVNNPLVFFDKDGKRPQVSICENEDGSIEITITNSIFLVAKNDKEREQALSTMGNPNVYFGGDEVITNINVGGANRNVKIKYNFDVKITTYTNETQAAQDAINQGFGTVVLYRPEAPSSYQYSSNGVEYIVLAKFEEKFRADFAHELTHDWAGLADLYALVKYKENKKTKAYRGYLLTPEGNVFLSLMNDAYSPLTSQDIQKIAQAAVDKNINRYGTVSGTFTESVLNIEDEAKALRDGNVINVGATILNNTGDGSGPFKVIKGQVHQGVRGTNSNWLMSPTKLKLKDLKSTKDEKPEGSHENVRRP